MWKLTSGRGLLRCEEHFGENLGKPHIIANAHTKKLENLPPLKQEDGQRLLAFSRSLNVAERTLTGMGPQYVGDLSHTNTLRELKRQLPLSMSQVKRVCG